MTYSYSYPPSDYAKSQGELVSGSHYYCEGDLWLTEEIPIHCHFEIGYTQLNAVIIVCYFEKGLGNPSLNFQQGNMVATSTSQLYQTDPKKLTGIAIVDDILIQAENLQCIQFKKSSQKAVGMYVAEKYHAINNELTSQKRKRAFYNISGLKFPNWFTRSHVKRSFEINDFDFITETPLRLQLQHKLKPDDISYPSETTGKLFVYGNEVKNWPREEIISFWCALMSLGIGDKIYWTSKFQPVRPFSTERHVEKVWYSRHFQDSYGFSGLFTRRGILGDKDVWSNLELFIKVSLDAVLTERISVELSIKLTKIIESYVSYRLVKIHPEGTVRLIATLTEELFKCWENKPPSESEKLKKGLLNLFKQQEFEIDGLEERVEMLRVTRNEIAHRGNFISSEQKGITKEYTNLIMMIPLIVMALVGYKGEFNDLYESS
ncbi:MAG: hypothetical protein ACFE0Q_16255 [Anaerolineae bacterium]